MTSGHCRTNLTRIWARFSLPGRSGDKEQRGGVWAASQHDGWSELSIHLATERAPCAMPTSGFCALVAARLNVNLEQDIDFCPGLSKSQDTNLVGMLRVQPNVGYGERILASALS